MRKRYAALAACLAAGAVMILPAQAGAVSSGAHVTFCETIGSYKTCVAFSIDGSGADSWTYNPK